jgi:hypothetical protein
MSQNRDELYKVYNFLYSSAPAERSEMGWPLCVYCGDPADAVDHVPPLSKIVQYRGLGVNREMYLLAKTCRPCNQMLGSTLQTDILSRIDEAKSLLRKKLGRRDVGYTWAEEDLEDLGRNLRSHVGSAMRKTESLIRRIEYRGGYRAVLGMLKDTE